MFIGITPSKILLYKGTSEEGAVFFVNTDVNVPKLNSVVNRSIINKMAAANINVESNGCNTAALKGLKRYIKKKHIRIRTNKLTYLIYSGFT